MNVLVTFVPFFVFIPHASFCLIQVLSHAFSFSYFYVFFHVFLASSMSSFFLILIILLVFFPFYLLLEML